MTRELEGLFDLALPCARPEEVDLEELVRCFERAVRSDPRQLQLVPLVTALAGDRSRPYDSLVRDLTEILFLPRTERTEYRNHPAPPGPWLFPKLMLEYAVWSRRLDEVVGSLLSPFCVRSCPCPPVGCCHQLGYDMGLIPDSMLRLQQLEACLRGWSSPPNPDRGKCRYHTDSGCALRLFKSPACLQFVCSPMASELRRVHGPERAQDLVDSLHALGCCDIDRSLVFERLALVVRAGQHCTSSSESRPGGFPSTRTRPEPCPARLRPRGRVLG